MGLAAPEQQYFYLRVSPSILCDFCGLGEQMTKGKNEGEPMCFGVSVVPVNYPDLEESP